MTVRILADDLTGALDCAACFTGDVGPVAVGWDLRAPADGSFALSSETRDLARDAAVRRVGLAMRTFPPGTPRVLFKKVDSLLRGHAAAEVAATMITGGLRRAVFAPAFPQQGRLTRGGHQHVRSDGGLARIEVDIGAELRALRLSASRDPADLDHSADPAVWVADAESEADLRAVVAQARDIPGPVLWCGTAGLAAALAVRAPPRIMPPHGRILAICGTRHPVATAQMAAARAVLDDTLVRLLPDEATGRKVEGLLRERGVAVLSADLPDASPAAARDMIGQALARLLPAIPAPDALVVMGGETLRQCCDAVGARGLIVDALVEPGIPHSRMTGGAWAGVGVISKSGAFGDDETVLRLIANASSPTKGITAGGRRAPPHLERP